MRTVPFRTGGHVDQQPRSWDEVPDVEVRTVVELKAVLTHLSRANTARPTAEQSAGAPPASAFCVALGSETRAQPT